MLGLIIYLFTMEMSYSPLEGQFYNDDLQYVEGYYELKLTPEILFFDKLIRVYGTAGVRMTRDAPAVLNFDPYQLDSIFGVEINYKGLTLGYKHQCIHPIITWEQPQFEPYNQAKKLFYLKYQTPELTIW